LRTAGGWSLTLELWKAIDHARETDASARLAEIPLEEALAWMNQGLEARIARAPEQYLWAYNRYKRL
jgi:lauroyl/myristoyl acyltransferase